MRDPGIEPGSSAWKVEIITPRLIALKNNSCKITNFPYLLTLAV